MTASRRTAFRLCYGALHVVMREEYRGLGHTLSTPGAATEIEAHVDWSATMQLRRDLDRDGCGVAEAMQPFLREGFGNPSSSHPLVGPRGSAGACSGGGASPVI